MARISPSGSPSATILGRAQKVLSGPLGSLRAKRPSPGSAKSQTARPAQTDRQSAQDARPRSERRGHSHARARAGPAPARLQAHCLRPQKTRMSPDLNPIQTHPVTKSRRHGHKPQSHSVQRQMQVTPAPCIQHPGTSTMSSLLPPTELMTPLQAEQKQAEYGPEGLSKKVTDRSLHPRQVHGST